MIFETARVVDTRRNHAVIVKETSSACEGCYLAGSCMSSGDVRCEKTFTALNEIGAKTGDRVEIGMPSGSFLLSVFLVYMMPILLLAVGVALGLKLAPIISRQFQGHLGTTFIASLCGLVFLIVAFAGLYVFNRWCKKKGILSPRILRILS